MKPCTSRGRVGVVFRLDISLLRGLAILTDIGGRYHICCLSRVLTVQVVAPPNFVPRVGAAGFEPATT